MSKPSEPMTIYGVDFTSAPSPKKPIVVADCAFHHQTLTLRQCLKLTDFEQFEQFLSTDGPWVAAMDFPLSMPHSWLAAMQWPTDWAKSVRHIQKLSLKAFCQTINDYCRHQPAGKKHHFRPIDRLAGACSPMTIYYTPVGKMFYQGAFRLLEAGVTVLPFQGHLIQSKQAQGKKGASRAKADPHRIVVEGYPALIARQLCPKQGYKYESPPASAAQKAAKDFTRKEMIQKLGAQWLEADFGITFDLNGHADTLWQDFTGDSLDAVFCALQAAWAYTQRDANFGIPHATEALAPDAQEGWIAVPPHFLKQKQ
ncbi:DUF429 domain-containing protein [Vampirovibrio chlorellavorus]|uniref:DUF429 domain-containing protein n=1 Tax=Vampirovibrio chlorellavorus TaxID=758823 RepID=UPI0026EFAEF9|nr:DUF429 domain-containing protein [Vampirovibrio chlorellavorus]